jgi:hypothetical protein
MVGGYSREANALESSAAHGSTDVAHATLAGLLLRFSLGDAVIACRGKVREHQTGDDYHGRQ